MATQTIGLNLEVTANTDKASKELDKFKGALGSPIVPSFYGPAISPEMAMQKSASGDRNVETSSFFSSSNSLEIQKGILVELRNLSTFFIRGNGNPALNQASQETKKNEITQADKDRVSRIKDISTDVTLAAGVYAALENYQTGSRRIAMREWQGDYFGAELSKVDRLAGAVSGFTGIIPTLGTVLGTFLGGPAGAMAGNAIGLGVKGVVDTVSNAKTNSEKTKIEEQQLHSETYKNRLRLNEESLAMYGGRIEDNTAVQNSHIAMGMQNYFSGAARNTGMDIDEFQSLSNEFSRYGVRNYETAGNLTRASALTQSYTGADATDFLGLQMRFGKDEDGAVDAMNYAFGASQATGLEKGQFGEFLNGLQSAVEDGIANGFVQSTEDVSKTMVMFSKLSNDNPAWQGQYGFQRLNQMNQGLRGATSLDNTSHLLAFQSLRGMNNGTLGVEHIKGEDALNTFALMERGFTPNTFKAISDRFSSQYGDDTMENVLAWKQLTGLNYTGAMQLYKMQKENKGVVTDDDIKKVMSNTEYNTDQKNMVNYLNDIKNNTSILGEGAFRDYLKGLAGIDSKYDNATDDMKRSLDASNGHAADLNSNVIDSLEELRNRGGYENSRKYAYLKAALATEQGQNLIKLGLSAMDSDERTRREFGDDNTTLVSVFDQTIDRLIQALKEINVVQEY